MKLLLSALALAGTRLATDYDARTFRVTADTRLAMETTDEDR